MKFIVRTTGTIDISDLHKQIPCLIECRDTTHNAMNTFFKSLEIAGVESCVNMEDDILLCYNFYDTINKIIDKHISDVIQFFSMRKDDLTIGTRYIDGSRFMMNQCFYLPEGMSKELREYADKWTGYSENPTGYDILMADYFKANKIKYLNICPNLVEHLPIKSRINPRRSTKRQSLTFNIDYYKNNEVY